MDTNGLAQKKYANNKSSDFWVKTILIGISLLYLGLVLVFPVASVVYAAFEN